MLKDSGYHRDSEGNIHDGHPGIASKPAEDHKCKTAKCSNTTEHLPSLLCEPCLEAYSKGVDDISADHEMDESPTESRALQAFLYILMRDEMSAGKMEQIMRALEDMSTLVGWKTYDNKHLASYAKELAERILDDD